MRGVPDEWRVVRNAVLGEVGDDEERAGGPRAKRLRRLEALNSVRVHHRTQKLNGERTSPTTFKPRRSARLGGQP